MIMQRKRSFEQAQSRMQVNPDRLDALEACWRATNYLGIAQLYLHDNVLLRRPLRREDIKPRPRGRWGNQPALNMVYLHLNRLIQDTDAGILLVAGAGYGAAAILANLFLEGTLGEHFPQLDRDETGLNELARQFTWPDGLPDHLVAQVPGTVQEGTGPGASLAHAAGAAFDNPDLTVACVIAEDDAGTGAALAAWQYNRVLNPVRDGAVLPILHLSGYTAAGPSLLGRMDNDELDNLFTGYGYEIGIVSGDDPRKTHEAMWQAMDWAFGEIRDLQEQARAGAPLDRPAWPMLILRTPAGWTAPREVDGRLVECTPRACGLPIPDPHGNPGHRAALEQWLRSIRPANLFDAAGNPRPRILGVYAHGDRRIGCNPHANGGQLRTDLNQPLVDDYAVEVPAPGSIAASATQVLAEFLRDTFHQSQPGRNFRLFCPDDTIRHCLPTVLEATGQAWMWPIVGTDEHLSSEGRVLTSTDEQVCQGWLAGYTLTGRHGLMAADVSVLPNLHALLAQHVRWLEQARRTPWRGPIPSLTWLLVPEPGGNGLGAAPGLLGEALDRRDSLVRVYLPPDANSLLCVMQQCQQSTDRINLVFVSPAERPQWLTLRAARDHCARGISAWDWAGHSTDRPDVVLASAGDAATAETVAAADLLRRQLPDLGVRVVNVVDLLSVRGGGDDGHTGNEPASLLGTELPVVFAFAGEPSLLRGLLRGQPNPTRFEVRGCNASARASTPFDSLVRSGMSRWHLAMAAIERADRVREAAGPLLEQLRHKLVLQEQSIRRYNRDLPEIAPGGLP